MKKLTTIAAILALAFVLGGCRSPKVLEGTVVGYDAATKNVIIKDGNAPNADVTMSLEGADIGADPTAGDLVRVAYEEQGGKNLGLRLMNLTRQKELKSGGGH
jgi:hypothetical protein